MDKPINKSTYKNIKRRKKQQAKRIIDKLIYNPPNLKKKVDKPLRNKLKSKARLKMQTQETEAKRLSLVQ